MNLLYYVCSVKQEHTIQYLSLMVLIWSLFWPLQLKKNKHLHLFAVNSEFTKQKITYHTRYILFFTGTALILSLAITTSMIQQKQQLAVSWLLYTCIKYIILFHNFGFCPKYYIQECLWTLWEFIFPKNKNIEIYCP